jgi:UDP-N-acetylmuramate--alanine ligase
MDAGRVICCFQPHTYTRTRIFLDRFAQVLKLADKVFVADIYAAREVNNSGVSSKDLVALVPGAEYAKDPENAAKMIAQYVREGDIVITCGAGDIFRTGRLLAEMLKNK